MSYRIYYTFRRDIFQGTLQINFMKRRIFTVEENIKRKVDLNVAGITISVITDEADIFVKAIEKKMDEEMKALLRNVRLSQFDAAMLCAIDFCADKLSAEKKLRNLEAQVSLYEVNLRRLKNEVNSLIISSTSNLDLNSDITSALILPFSSSLAIISSNNIIEAL